MIWVTVRETELQPKQTEGINKSRSIHMPSTGEEHSQKLLYINIHVTNQITER